MDENRRQRTRQSRDVGTGGESSAVRQGMARMGQLCPQREAVRTGQRYPQRGFTEDRVAVPSGR